MNATTETTQEKRVPDGELEGSSGSLRKRLWDAVVDANPVLAKELLVTARTPTFVGAMVGTPLLLGAMVLLIRLGMSSHTNPTAGRDLFQIYFTGLTITLGIVGAALGSTVVVQEREAGALDALKFSSLSPRQIVFGKFAAVLLANGVIVVCTLPLLAFVLSMGGVSIGYTFVGVSIAVACGVMAASVGIAVSSHVANTRRAPLGSLLAAGLLGMGVSIWLAVASDFGRGFGPIGVAEGYLTAPFDDRYVALLLVVPAYAIMTVLWLGYAAATSGLMDPNEDRSHPIKQWALGAYAMGMVALGACRGVVDERGRTVLGGASMIVVSILALVLLFVFVGEPISPTRRMRTQPRSRMVRVLFPWCLAPSVLFAVVTGGIALLLIPGLVGAMADLGLAAWWALSLLSTLGGFMGWIAARRGGTRARRDGATALAVLTLFFVFIRAGSRGPSWVDAICPLWLDAADGSRAQSVLGLSVLAWSTSALASLGLMLDAVRSRTAHAT
jgi:ABC-type transport system involved in multi-copper enzyme maturation permease subunit